SSRSSPTPSCTTSTASPGTTAATRSVPATSIAGARGCGSTAGSGGTAARPGRRRADREPARAREPGRAGRGADVRKGQVRGLPRRPDDARAGDVRAGLALVDACRREDGGGVVPGGARRARAERPGDGGDGRRHRAGHARGRVLLRAAGPRQLGGGRRAVRVAPHHGQRGLRGRVAGGVGGRSRSRKCNGTVTAGVRGLTPTVGQNVSYSDMMSVGCSIKS